MKRFSVGFIACLSGLVLSASVVFAQVVPGLTVEEYATVDGPADMSFDPTGILYVGHDLSFSGGNSTQATTIHQIGIGGFPVNPYGPSLPDPDSVLFDATGAISGIPGSVLVAGIDSVVTDEGYVRAIAPDQTAGLVYPLSGSYRNPNDLKYDSTGRLLVADNDGDVFASSAGTLSLLFALGVDSGSIAIDGSDNIYSEAVDGILRIHDSSGNLLDPAFVTGLAIGVNAPMDFGRGCALWGNDLYAINRGTGELLRIDSLGNVTVIGTDFAGPGRTPADLLIGPDCAMYVSFIDEHRIIRIIPEPASLALLLIGGLAMLRRRG